MKIGVIGPIWENIPPIGYGGTELVVYNLVEGLVKLGHDVTLFGPGTARISGKLVSTVEKPLRDMDVSWTNIAYNLYHISEAFDRASEFDILHMHLNKSQDYLALPLAQVSKTPVVFTIHFQLPSPTYNRDRYLVLHKYKNLPFISISNSQRGEIGLNFIATVYNALQIEKFLFQATPEDYFVWLGKVNPLKGTKDAILAAIQAGVKLMLIGVVDKGVPEMLAYYENEVKPLIDGEQIFWRGEVTIEEKAKLLGGARGFLNPIAWEEPFGLVMIEAQATGTPVISFKRGAAPELIIEGKTGFLVDNAPEMVEKIKAIGGIPRMACRRNVEEHFTVEKMAQAYEKAYNMAIEKWITV